MVVETKRPASDRTSAAPPAALDPPFLSAALALGLAAGFAEVVFLGAQKLLLDKIVFMGRHAFWMVPLAEALVCVSAGLVLFLLARAMPRLRSHVLAYAVPASLAALAVLLLYPPLHIAAAVLLAVGVGVQVGRMAVRWPALARRLVRATSLGLGALVIATFAILVVFPRLNRAAPAAAAAPDRPSILLLILDTVRASSLSVYGNPEPTTPHLAALGNSGVVFERAISPAPWTLPSHASMFTGLSPERLSADWRRPLDDEAPTLAEYLWNHGYETGGFVANLGYTGWETGLDRGFGHYRDDPISVRQLIVSSVLVRAVVGRDWFRDLLGTDENFVRKTAADINAEFLDWLSGRDDERPFFAFLNYYDAHAPYMPPEPFRSRFADGAPRGAISPLHRWNSDPFGPPPPPAVIEQERDAYEAAIAWLDDEIGALLRELERRDMFDNTIVVVTSDHGEEFGEHGLFDHGNSMYLENLHVPLIVAYPAALSGGIRVETAVSLTGLPQMIVRLAGFADDDAFPDARLAHVLAGAATATSPALSDVTHATGLPDWFPVSRGDMVSLVTDRWHYIRNGDGIEELYDLTTDPSERTDLAASAAVADDLARFRAYLSTWRSIRLDEPR